jgi:hypothetical protein
MVESAFQIFVPAAWPLFSCHRGGEGPQEVAQGQNLIIPFREAGGIDEHTVINRILPGRWEIMLDLQISKFQIFPGRRREVAQPSADIFKRYAKSTRTPGPAV